MALEFDASAEDLKVYLDEADEMLQHMEEQILVLEQNPGNPEPLHEIFRSAHTLKGSSATLGHRPMAEVTHGMENVLDKLRKGKLQPTRPLIDTLFACLDVLKTLKEEVAAGEDVGIETQPVLARLTEVEGQASAATVAAGVAPAPVESGLTLGPAEAERIRSGSERGQTAWALTVASVENASMPAVRFFQVLLALREVGEIIASLPEQEEIEQDQVGEELHAVFLTRWEEPALRSALGNVPEVRIDELRPWAPAQRDAAPAEEPRAAAADSAGIRRTVRTVRVDVEVLDNLMNQVGELVIDRTRLMQVLGALEATLHGDEIARDLQATAAHIGRVTSELQEEIVRARMLPVDNLFRKFPRMVRDLANKAQKDIRFEVQGQETELDRSVIEEIGDPLMHLLRNAIDHGIEPPPERLRSGKPAQGTVSLAARHEENQIVISVRDDGRGIDPNRLRAAAVRKGLMGEDAARRLNDEETMRLIFAPGFSTAEQVSDISGRGVGLDVVHRNIERLNGNIEILSRPGQGTEFRIKLPLTLAIIRALLVQHGGVTYAVPLSAVTETLRWPAGDVKLIQRREVIVSRGALVPLVRLDHAFGLGRPADWEQPPDLMVIIVNVFGRQAGLVVDGLVGEGDVVIKSLGKYIGEVAGISGATILGDGSVALILDVASLVASSGLRREHRTA